MLRSTFSKIPSPTNSALVSLPIFSTTPALVTSQCFGTTQLSSMPASTSRKPHGKHRGPNKRQVNKQEAQWYRYVKRWELEMDGEWDQYERFQHLPKPKKLLGNEACEIVWPYAVLLENILKIHPFTKSVYVYYPQHTVTEAGAKAAALARRFSRECLIPICFHNNQCDVEAEMMLEYSDSAWIVVHCLDGRFESIRVGDGNGGDTAAAATGGSVKKNQDELKIELLQKVLETASKLGTSVKNPEQISLQLNERPLQNGFIRVDYQWMGDTIEERQSHLVRWIDPEEQGVQPVMYNREGKLADWLNTDDGRAPSPKLRDLSKLGAKRMVRASNNVSNLSGYFNRYSQISSTWGGAAGYDGSRGSK